MSIRRRILITFTAIVLIGGLVQLLIAGSQLQTATLEFFRNRLETDALTAAASLATLLEERSGSEADRGELIQQTLANIQQEVGHDYLLLDADKKVITSSSGIDAQVGDSFGDEPELQQAHVGSVGYNVRADASGVTRMFVAAPITHERSEIGYLVLSQPMSTVDDEVRQRWLELVLATLPVIALVISASLWISTTISRPIQHLRNSALKMAEGSLDTRIDAGGRDEVGQLGNAFNYMAEQIEKLVRAQRSFVSNAAHELRNPLMTLKLRIEALQDPALAGDQRAKYLDEMAQEVDYLSELVSALLVLARIDEGQHETDEGAYDVTALLQDIARQWRIEAQQANLEFEAAIAPDLPDLRISAHDLRLVLTNLLSNALKYTPRGKVTLRAWREAQTFRLRVEDSGRGFSADETGLLFDRFYRAPAARDQQVPGTGLGLSIARAVIEFHHGTIEAHSDGIDKGAAFTITLPG